MSALSLARLRTEGESLMRDLSREQYLAHAGHKPGAELQAAFERYPAVLSSDALELTREEFLSTATTSEAHRAARLLLDWQAEMQIHRALAAHDEREIAWEARSRVSLEDGRVIPYSRITIELANTHDRPQRLMMERARALLVNSELAPMRMERFQRERELTESLNIAPGYVATFTALSGIDVTSLAVECEWLLRETEGMWAETVGEVTRAKLGIDPRDATRADALALMRGREFDGAFPGGAMEPAIRRQMTEMAIDADAGGHIRYDIGEREGKRSRAFCAAVQVPEEVYLVLRPYGGQADYRTLLHELGHALHFANARADLPFEYRWLGDNSVTESYAMLFDHLMQNPGWLLRYTELRKSDLPVFQRAAGVEELQFLRRYAAKLLYEITVYEGRVSWESLPGLYVDTLSGATLFRYDPADAFVDLDPRFYTARYLRAWQLQALLTRRLTDLFDDDWWRNPRAGPWLVEQLFGEGQRESADEIARRTSDIPLSFEPLIRSTEKLLAA